MITKARYLHNGICKASLLALNGHAETNNVTHISMFRVGFRLDQLDWQKVKETIQDLFNCSTVQVNVLALPAVVEQSDAGDDLTPETPASAEKTHGVEISSALQTAKQNDKALNLIYNWVTNSKPPSTRELQSCPCLAWSLANHWKVSKLKVSFYAIDSNCHRQETTSSKKLYPEAWFTNHSLLFNPLPRADV